MYEGFFRQPLSQAVMRRMEPTWRRLLEQSKDLRSVTGSVSSHQTNIMVDARSATSFEERTRPPWRGLDQQQG